VLHAFCSADNCADGAIPEGALVLDSFGAIFGATLSGGENKGGVVYQLKADGKLHVLHSFCGTKVCNDARYPNGVILDASGHVLGVATAGGKKGGGAVFRITP
jgi:uncharacterized repeat protein (TIGR03803 family)